MKGKREESCKWREGACMHVESCPVLRTNPNRCLSAAVVAATATCPATPRYLPPPPTLRRRGQWAQMLRLRMRKGAGVGGLVKEPPGGGVGRGGVVRLLPVATSNVVEVSWPRAPAQCLCWRRRRTLNYFYMHPSTLAFAFLSFWTLFGHPHKQTAGQLSPPLSS